MRKTKPDTRSRFSHIIDCQHLCLLLKKLPPEDSLSIDELDDLLDLLGVETSINNLFLVLANIKTIAAISDKICKHPRWRFAAETIRQAQNTAETIKKSRETLGKAVQTRHDKEHNKSFDGLVDDNPLYATLGYLPKDISNLQGYFQLVTQVLLCHVQSTRTARSERLNSSLGRALLAIREIARAKSSSLIPMLPATPHPPEEYLDAISKIAGHDDLPVILRYLTKILGRPRENTAQSDDQPPVARILEREQSLPAGTMQQIELPLELAPTIQEEPDTFEDETGKAPPGLVYAFAEEGWRGENPTDLKKAAVQAAKSRSKDNQLFHFAWDTLNQQDTQVLFHYIFPPSPPRNAEERKGRLQLALGFMTGMSASRIAGLKVASSSDALEEFDGYLTDRGTLRLISMGPEYKTVLDEAARDQAHPKQNYIDLELPDYLAQAIEGYLAGSQPAAGSALLFPDTAQQVQLACNKIISRLNKEHGTRLTYPRIQGYMDRNLGSRPGGDLATASLALGKEIYLARTRIHYASFDADTLQRQCRNAWNTIAKDAGRPDVWAETYPEREARHVGTPVRPKVQAVQVLIDHLANYVEENRGKLATLSALVAYHNAYTTYTVLMTAYCTGHRATNSPFIPEVMIDRETGFAVVRDKDSADFYHSRLVWLPPACLNHLSLYQKHLDRLKALDNSQKNSSPSHYYLKPDGHSEPVTKTRLIDHLKAFGFHLPPNVQRHLLKSELQENGCPAEVIEILLGHWHLGQEGWTQASALNPLDFRDELAKHLPLLLRRLGLVPLAGAKRLPAVELCLGEEKPERKSRRTVRRTSTGEDFLVADPPGPAWFRVLGTVFQNKPAGEAFKEQQVIVLRKVRRIMPELYAASEPGLAISPEIISHLVRSLTPKPKQPRLYYKRLNFLIDGLAWGKAHLAWNVELPPRPVIVPPGYNRVRPSLMQNLKVFRNIEEAFLRDLEQPLSPGLHLRLGQTLFSAVLFGGINHQIWLGGFLPGLAGHLYQHDDLLWVDLWAYGEIPPGKDGLIEQRNPSRYRRWIADPTTKLLIYRWLKEHPDDRGLCTKQKLTDVVLAYQNHLQALAMGNPKGTPYRPLPLNKILAAANARTTLTLPPYLSAYAENRLLSTSLPDPAWLRLLTGRNISISLNAAAFRKKSRPPILADTDSQEQIKLLRKLRALVPDAPENWKDGKEIREAIKDYLIINNARLWPALELLARWAIQLLSPRAYNLENRQKKPERPSTVSNYLGTFSEELLAAFGSLDLLELEEDELQRRLGEVGRMIGDSRRLDDEPGKKKKDRGDFIIERLNQFLGYLQAFHEFPELRAKLENNGVTICVGTSVRSNLLSLNEYQVLLAHLGWGRSRLERHEKMTLVAAILCFRGGLRLEETHGLLIADIQGKSRLELLVRPNRFRGLKNEYSRRRIPLYALMPPDELEFVKEWHSFRGTEVGATPGCPLFTDGPFEFKPLREQTLFAPLRTHLKELTGDDGMVIHHLRHSFATWTLAQLSLRGESDQAFKPLFLRHSDFEPGFCENLRRELLNNEIVGRKSLYAVAALMGHADTETSTGSYIHLCDWLTGGHLSDRRCAPDLSVKTLAAVSGCSPSKIYQAIQGGNHPMIACGRQMTKEQCNALQHPLLAQANLQPRPEQYTPCAETRQVPFDVILHDVCNDELPAGVSLPSSQLEIDLLQNWHEKFTKLKKSEQKHCAEIAGMILTRFKLPGIIECIKYDEARQALTLLNALGIGDRQLLLCYHGSRWVNQQMRKEAYSRWRERLGGKIFKQKKLFGRKDRNGKLVIHIETLDFDGKFIDKNKNSANAFSFFVHMISVYFTPKTS